MMFGDEMKKIFLAGIGAVASTVESSQQMVDKLVKKGELTVEQGKVLNEELKHNIKSQFSNMGTVGETEKKASDNLLDAVDEMSEEERKELLKKLTEMGPSGGKEN